ncbi:glycerate kinase [Cryobacterium sp. MP_M5]|uniref:glycerate kinase n=1 Tax=unclassified Cryobacterium TaxID=2649013 RepID=UPI001A2A6E19|nr:MULTISPECIES: glycerate kinase [unclassified Cryobacterium]MBG6056834.1 glycerate kinase [Cryobacterium sp. MP_M3]MEC5175034.1 glycerate kinase [Cryobacterium sp. MP_M5]
MSNPPSLTPARAGGRAVVIAPDSFKGTIGASDAARRIAAGWASVRPQDRLRLLPMADGGEGTLDAFELAVPGATRMPVTVPGPDDRPVDTHWLLLPDGTGVVELAATSGITLLDRLRPLDAHTLGFGQAIAAALEHGVTRLLLAIGGSGSTDGGSGMLRALGAQILDSAGRPVPPGGRGLARLAAVELSGLRPLPPGGVLVLTDVTSPLLGERGAAAVFGPQKGASPEQVAELEEGLARWAAVVGDARTGAGVGTGVGTAGARASDGAAAGVGAGASSDVGAAAGAAAAEMPGAGAAGGTGFGLLAWGATLAPGADAVAEALGVPAAVRGASVVVTGEGRFDSQSAAGKVPGHLAALAADAGAQAMLVAGQIEAPTDGFTAVVSLTDLAGGRESATRDAAAWLERAGARLAEAYRPDEGGTTL